MSPIRPIRSTGRIEGIRSVADISDTPGNLDAPGVIGSLSTSDTGNPVLPRPLVPLVPLVLLVLAQVY